MDELKVIEEALNVANAKGCYNLQESYNIKHCLEVVKQIPKQLESANKVIKQLSDESDKWKNNHQDLLVSIGEVMPEKSLTKLTKEQAPPPKLKSHK